MVEGADSDKQSSSLGPQKYHSLEISGSCWYGTISRPSRLWLVTCSVHTALLELKKQASLIYSDSKSTTKIYKIDPKLFLLKKIELYVLCPMLYYDNFKTISNNPQ